MEVVESTESTSINDICKDDIGIESTLESFTECGEVRKLIENLRLNYDDKINFERSFERFTCIFDRYQEQPHLLDPYLNEFLVVLLNLGIGSDTEVILKHQCFKLLYIITKVRGHKVVLRHLPHEVSDLEPVLSLLSCQDPLDTSTWETRYILLLWLSIIVMIPFQLTRLDGNVTELSVKKSVIERVLDVGKQYILSTDKSQDAAAYLTSKFVTRPDVRQLHLNQFIDWTLNGFSIGQLSSLALLFKHGDRDMLLPHASRVLHELLNNTDKTTYSTVFRKLIIKLAQRIAMTFLKPRIASWRYQRGNRSLELNLTSQEQVKQQTEIKDEDADFEVPEDVELILQTLFNGLNDTDTVIRWSAAKGIGRVASRLHKELADEVVGSVLELFGNRDRDAVWHGGCLALAELGRRGLLLPERLPDVVPVVVKALVYDEQKGSYSVGDHIRDAACYVCWSFARAYDAQEMKPFVNEVASALLTVTIFDREIHCRRAASAAFQENVGRQGTFPNGIDIVTTADYFAVGNRKYSFLNISVFIAQFEVYRHALINHLVDFKINHWDVNIRELASLALHNLTPFDSNYMINTVLPKLLPLATGSDINSRHGAILAIAEIISSLFLNCQNSAYILDETIIKKVRDIIPTLQEKKLYRGFGSELMRTASCKLIEKIAISKLPFHEDPIVDIWQNIIDDSLRLVDYGVISVASGTISHFCSEYYKSTNGKPIVQKQEWLINNYLHELQASVETTRMGFAMALGALPKFMLDEKLDIIMLALIECTKINEKTMGWFKARKEAQNALVAICKTVALDKDNSGLKNEHLTSVMDCLLNGLTDYTIDSCGDVGSHVRSAALHGIKSLVVHMVEKDENLITPELSKKIICGVVQQCVEKIENVRQIAGNTFFSLLHGDMAMPHIPHKEQLLLIFPKESSQNIRWNRPNETFPSFAMMLSLSSYLYSLLLGFTATIGSLSEHLVRVTVPAINGYLRSASKKDILMICDTMLKIFEDNVGLSRITLPLLKSIDQLLSSGYFDCAFHESDLTERLLELVKKEISTCKDPTKIMNGVTVLCDLLPFNQECRSKVQFQLCILLCHPWPLIRKDTATKMFTAFATYDGLVENEDLLMEIMNILSETNWVEARETIRPIRNQLCDLLNIQRPVFLRKK